MKTCPHCGGPMVVGVFDALRREVDGHHLRPQCWALLEILCNHTPRILSKDDLIRLLYKHRGVPDGAQDAMRVSISRINKAIHSTQYIIESYPGRGYRIGLRESS